MSEQATIDPAPTAPQPPRRWRVRWGLRRRMRRWGAGRVRLVGYLSGGVAVLLSADGLVQRTGVTITQVAVTGAGGLLDLRFKVLDPDKAHAIHDPATPPAIVDERSGLILSRLFMGHSHSGPYHPAVTYYLVFENNGNWVHRGSKVTVLLGNAQVEHVVVA